jgi:hypothetical protein
LEADIGMLEADNSKLEADLKGTRLALDEREAEAYRRERIMQEVWEVVFKDDIDMYDEEAVKGRLKRYKEDQELLIQNARVQAGGIINTPA